MRRLWLVVQWALVAAVAWFVVKSVAHNWAEIRHSSSVVHLDLGALAAAAGIILATYALLIGAWRAVLMGWGERLRYPVAARIWCLSNLARYVPGRVWQIAGMAALAQKAGITPWAAVGSAIIVQLLAIATGAMVTGLAAPQAEHPMWVAASGVIALLAALTLTWGRMTAMFSRWLSAALGRPFELRPVGKGALLLSAAVTTLAWLAYGLALYLCTAALLGRAALDLRTAIGVFTGSYVLGLIAVMTPGGLGIREGALLFWLTGPLGPAGAVVVTIGSRLLMTAAELLAALITLPLTTRSADGT
ncbi:MAG: lysylphosphatidylglycerol synthase domain-containing protein [Gemmatimonadota bacterium]|jgi:hypothetical protein